MLKMFTWSKLEFLFLVVTLFIFYGVLLTNIDTGYELGDHGFYLLHLHQAEEITHTLTHFGLVWTAIFGEHGIVLNRVINIAMILLSGFSLVGATRYLSETTPGFKGIPQLLFIAAAAYSTHFLAFILDPNYNSMSLIFTTFGIALLATGFEAMQRAQRKWFLCAGFGFGAIVAAIVFTKSSITITLGAFAITALTAISVIRKDWFSFWCMILLGLIGFLAFIAFMQLSTGLVPHIIESFRSGYDAYANSEGHSVGLLLKAPAYIHMYLYRSKLALFEAGYLVLVPTVTALGILIAAIHSSKKEIFAKYQRTIITACSLLLILVVLAAIMFGATPSYARSLMVTLFNVNLLITITVLFLNRFTIVQFVFTIGMLLIPFLAFFGTNNGYYEQILLLGAGLSLFPAHFVVTAASNPQLQPIRKVILSLSGCAIALSGYHMYNEPFRLAGRLADADQSVAFPNGDTLRVTPSVATFVTEIRRHAHSGASAERPTVFDFTGQLPISVYLLNGKVPGAAWSLDMLNVNFNRIIFKTVKDEAFLHGWLLLKTDSEEPSHHFEAFRERISSMGLKFEDYFEPVANLSAPYLGRSDKTMNLVLYKPVQR